MGANTISSAHDPVPPGTPDPVRTIRPLRIDSVLGKEARLARPQPLWLSLEPIAIDLRRARRLFVATDFDGTLAPIVEDPDRAAMPARARRVLSRLARAPHARVAILSGRRLSDLRRRVRIRGVFLSGLSGLETQEPGGRPRAQVVPRLPPALRAGLRQWCARFPGSWVEDKRLTLAVHYRNLAPRLRASFAAGVRRRLLSHAGAAELEHGRKVLEVRPAGARNKAAVLDAWLGRRTGLVVYVGDDTNDEPAFARVRRRGGVGIVVGRRPSKARFRVPSTDGAIWFLEWVEREWAARVSLAE